MSPNAPGSPTLAELYARHRSSASGLPGAEAERRLQEQGANEPSAAAGTSWLGALLRFSINPLVLILLVASAVSALAGEVVNAVIIAVIVVVSSVLNFTQAYRSERAARRLREQVAPTASVLRDGAFREVARRSLVRGDVVRVSAGDLVPADARLITSRDLHVNEAALTGESLPSEKVASSGLEPEGLASPAWVHLGTSVLSGVGTALVVATGRDTAFGDIAARLGTRPPETEFERGMHRFGLLILRVVLFLVLFIVLVSLGSGRPALQSVLFAVALAVGLTPEFLPMIMTVTLSRGAVRMAREKVVVKHLAAIQNLGSIDVLCSDKTGTLTAGTMSLHRSLDALGNESPRALELAFLNSHYETGIKNPLDLAIDAQRPPEPPGFEKTDELPFDFERRRLSVVLRRDGEHLLVTKGAPEGVLAACVALEHAGGRVALTAEHRALVEATFQRLSEEGFRVLAVASRTVDAPAGFTPADERDLVLAGFLTFSDHLLEDAAETLAALARDGVEVKILTGDNERVSVHLCREVGLDPGRIILGSDLDRLGDIELAHVAERTRLFARVSPAQKNRVLRALRARSHVVGYIGDGINDAPSLHEADVGISVANGADVAKDAADIILLEHHLRVLHSGILNGRRAFGNVFKYLLMGTSSNFGNMFSMAGATLFLPFLPMLPTQILLNNFLYDLAQLTIPTDHVDPSWIGRPQRWSISIIRDFMLVVGPVSSVFDFLTFAVLLEVFRFGEPAFHTGWFLESLATQTLVVFVIRTTGVPWADRPSLPLALTVIFVVALALLLPFTPLGPPLGLVPLPAGFYAYLAGAVALYLVLVEVVKRRVMRRLVRR